MMAILEPLSHGLCWVALIIAAIAVALGIYVRRFRVFGHISDAWLAGVVGVGVLALVFFAVT